MNARLARRLTGLYPAAWRTRYGAEFELFLEERPSDIRSILNVIAWGFYERILSLGDFSMDQRQHSVFLMVYAFLAAFAAGVNFYWTVADTPLAAAMHNHATILASWNLVRVGSLLALAAVAMAGIPILLRIVGGALVDRRRDVLCWLAVPPGAAIVFLIWTVAATVSSGGHWVPTPWDVAGDWAAPRNWPSLETRWALGLVTFILMTGGLIVGAVSARQAVRRSDLSKTGAFWFKVPSILLAGAVTVMALGVLTWGWFVQLYEPSAFHVRNGGFFNSTNFASWAASCLVFLAAAVAAIQSARSARSLKTE